MIKSIHDDNKCIYGIGSAIASNICPKILIPNPISDSEQLGLSFYDMVIKLLKTAEKSAGKSITPTDICTYILIDSEHGQYNRPMHLKKLRDLGIEILDLPLITPESSPYYDESRIIHVLLSLT